MGDVKFKGFKRRVKSGDPRQSGGKYSARPLLSITNQQEPVCRQETNLCFCYPPSSTQLLGPTPFKLPTFKAQHLQPPVLIPLFLDPTSLPTGQEESTGSRLNQKEMSSVGPLMSQGVRHSLLVTRHSSIYVETDGVARHVRGEWSAKEKKDMDADGTRDGSHHPVHSALPLIWPAASLSLLRPSGSGPDCWTWFGLESHSRSRTHLLLDVKEVSTLLGAETRRTAEMG